MSSAPLTLSYDVQIFLLRFDPTDEGLALDTSKKTKRIVYPRRGSSPDAGARTLGAISCLVSAWLHTD